MRKMEMSNNTTEIMTGNKGTYNHFHDILRLFDVLPNFPFTRIETKRDY